MIISTIFDCAIQLVCTYADFLWCWTLWSELKIYIFLYTCTICRFIRWRIPGQDASLCMCDLSWFFICRQWVFFSRWSLHRQWWLPFRRRSLYLLFIQISFYFTAFLIYVEYIRLKRNPLVSRFGLILPSVINLCHLCWHVGVYKLDVSSIVYVNA